MKSCSRPTTCCHASHGAETYEDLTTTSRYISSRHMPAVLGWEPHTKTKFWTYCDVNCCLRALELRLLGWHSSLPFVRHINAVTLVDVPPYWSKIWEPKTEDFISKRWFLVWIAWPQCLVPFLLARLISFDRHDKG